MVESASAGIEAILTEILLKPENRQITQRVNEIDETTKLKVTVDTWNPASRDGNFFEIPVRNSKCVKDTCTRELYNILKNLKSRKDILTPDSNYSCEGCKQERCLKDLTIDLTMAGMVSRLSNARYNTLISENKADDLEEQQSADGIKTKIEKSGIFCAVDETGDTIFKNNAHLHTSFIPLQKPSADIYHSNVIKDIKPVLATANAEISIILAALRENPGSLEHILGDGKQFDQIFSQLKDGFGMFECSEQKLDREQLKNQKMVFFLEGDKLINIHYPSLPLTFRDINMIQNKRLFAIPKGAKLTTFLDSGDKITKILVTGGVSKEAALSSVYEISFAFPEASGKVKYIIKQANVEEKKSLSKAKYSHSIIWNPVREQIYIIGGVGDPREPTKSVEIGKKENGNWKWEHGMNLQRPRICASVCDAGSYIYVFGGFVKKNLDDYPRIDEGPHLPVYEVERLDLENKKSEIISKLELVIPIYSICFPDKFAATNEIIFFGGNNKKAFSFNLTNKTVSEDKAEIRDLSLTDGNQCWTIDMKGIIMMVPKMNNNGFQLLSYDLSKREISYSEI